MPEMEIGFVTHYFGHIGVAAIQLTAGELKVGDQLRIKGHSSDFLTAVESIQVQHQAVAVARPGDNVGIKVAGHAREHDKVYKLVP